ncbi:MAG: hypothetical protein KDD11_20110, partial [Acidobacteria bacterium]|nr:hypothetical protein [Acidobacteriota bacterium]
LECASDIGRREITLFANGTVRLREGEVLQDTFEPSELGASWQAPGLTTHLYLGELEPAELETYLRRLRHENLAETEERYGGVVAGEWVEHCSLELALPGRPARRFDFGRYDSLDLALSRVVAIIDELPDHVQREEGAVRGIPGDYQPAVGDVLERRDGNLFELVLFTSDGLGVELQGVDQPVSFIVSFDDLRTDFVRLVERP